MGRSIRKLEDRINSEPPADTKLLRAAPLITGMDVVVPGKMYRRVGGLDHHLIVLTCSGDASIGARGAMVPQRTGDVVLIDPGCAVNQDNSPTRPWRRIWAIFEARPWWYDLFDWPQPRPGYRQIRLPSVRRGTPVRDALEAMHRYATGTLRRRNDLAMNALEAALIWCDQYNPESRQALIDPRVVRAMDFVCRDLRRRLTLEQIADAADLSVPHLVKLFRKHLDVSPMQFVERQRMQRACDLLRLTARSVAEIADEVGFDDSFYFSTRFRRHTRTSPRAYRQSAAKGGGRGVAR